MTNAKCQYFGLALDENNWESHIYYCEKQPIVDCGKKGHKIKAMVLSFEGCQNCEIQILEESAQKLYCIDCGKQSKKKLIDGDEGWNDFECLECHAKIREFLDQDYYKDEGPSEPRESYDPGYAAELYRKQIEGGP